MVPEVRRAADPPPLPLTAGPDELLGPVVIADDPCMAALWDPGPGFGIKAFTAREWDPETGLYYYRARYYDPKGGRFLSEDPIGFGGGVNFYAYVGNGPTNWIDPFGLWPGQMPPPPPGYNPGTWATGQWDDGRWEVTDPDGNRWTAHPDDAAHWRHWDKRGPDGKDQGRWPPNSKKPRANQKKLPGDRCETDPSGNAPEWKPPGPSWNPMGNPNLPFVPLPGYVPPLVPVPLTWGWLVFVYP
jgi:RHS repeat-associated protein